MPAASVATTDPGGDGRPNTTMRSTVFLPSNPEPPADVDVSLPLENVSCRSVYSPFSLQHGETSGGRGGGWGRDHAHFESECAGMGTGDREREGEEALHRDATHL